MLRASGPRYCPAVKRQALLLSLLALGLSGCGGDEPPQARQPKPFLGVAGGAALSSPRLLDREVRLMADSGVTTIRAPFYWWRAQPRRGEPPRFRDTDWVVAAAARERISVLPVVLGTPAWAARRRNDPASPPAGTASYAAFLRALIGRYGPRGSFWEEHGDLPKVPLRDWQIWNEPDRPKYWSDQPYAPGYVRLARAARDAIKRGDPGARVVMAGFAERSWDSLAELYRAGGRGAFDAAAIHPYTFEPRGVLRIVELARAAMRRARDGATPLWLTEVTWSSGQTPGRPRFPFETTEPDQAARLSRALPLLIRNRRRLGIDRIYWEKWLSTERDHSDPFNFSGLRGLRPNGSVRSKPALAAYRRVALRVRGR